MQKRTISYQCDQTTLKGHLFHHPDLPEKRPGILIAHAWRGIDDYVLDKAQRIAELGYIAFVADVYGMEKPAQNDEEALARLLPLFTNRTLLRQRIIAGYQTLKSQPEVSEQRIGAMGFCFGGLTVIELLRSATPIRGAVSFHGVLGYKLGEHQAEVVPPASGNKGALLLLHGHDDPLVSSQDIANLQKEMTEQNVDWQMHVYGHAAHAFTNQEAHSKEGGMMYNERADTRAWQSMQNFFRELF